MLKTNEGRFFVISALMALVLVGVGMARHIAANHLNDTIAEEAVAPLPSGVAAADVLKQRKPRARPR